VIDHRRFILVFALVPTVFDLGCTQRVAARPESPRELVELEPRLLDLGPLPYGTTYKFTASINNHGDKSVKIKGVKASCGCTVVQVGSSFCEPGQSIPLNGTIRLTTNAGPFRHYVTVYTDAAEDNEFTLEILGNAESSFLVVPKSCVLTPSYFEKTSSDVILDVVNKSSETVHIQEPTGLPVGITAKLDEKHLAGGAKARLLVHAEPVAVTEEDFELILPTSQSSECDIKIPCQLRPHDGIRLAPRALHFGVLSKRAALDGNMIKLIISQRMNPPLTIKDVRTPHYFQFDHKSETGHGDMTLYFRFVDAFPGIALKDHITVEFAIVGSPALGADPIRLTVPIDGILNDG
jgi:hypothetical protein